MGKQDLYSQRKLRKEARGTGSASVCERVRVCVCARARVCVFMCVCA